MGTVTLPGEQSPGTRLRPAELRHTTEEFVEVDRLRQVGVGLNLLQPFTAGRRHHDDGDVASDASRICSGGTASRP